MAGEQLHRDPAQCPEHDGITEKAGAEDYLAHLEKIADRVVGEAKRKSPGRRPASELVGPNGHSRGRLAWLSLA